LKQFYYVFQSMRPNQWTKNLVVFAGLVFSRNLFNGALTLRTLEAFVIFCLLSGMVYVINDAGMVIALYVSWLVGREFFVVVVSFVVLNLAYSFGLKRVVLLDVMSISISFTLRAIGGVEALRSLHPEIEISPWLLICTLFLSLFLAFCKRRHELVTMPNARDHRRSLQEYSPALLDQLVGISAGGSVLAYAIYTIWPDTVDKFGSTDLVYTVPVVLIGVMRYLYLVYTKQKGGSPSRLFLHEKFILITVLAWILLVIAILGGL
jgi:4-hydroxybenzoate polyprenyltransferase